MTLNPYRLQKAIQKGGRVRGVSVPPALDLAVESVVVPHVVGLWNRAARAALALVPTADMVSDANQREILRAINIIFRRYSGLTALNERLTAAYERGNALHKARYLYEMERALGTDVSDLLSDPKTAAQVRGRIDTSVDLIITLDEDMKSLLAQEIWGGIASGQDEGSLRKLILEKRVGVSQYRARLIARDQTSKLFSQLSRARQEDVGITGYIWRTVGDGAVRDTHAALDGTPQKWGSPPSVGHPGDDIQCRCIADPDMSTAKLFA